MIYYDTPQERTDRRGGSTSGTIRYLNDQRDWAFQNITTDCLLPLREKARIAGHAIRVEFSAIATSDFDEGSYRFHCASLWLRVEKAEQSPRTRRS